MFLPVHPKTDLIAPPASGSAATGAVHSAAAACFRAAGAAVRLGPAGQGTAIYAMARDGGDVGLLEGPTPAVAARIAQVFAGGGWRLKPLKNNPRAVGIYKGTLTRADSALLSKCGG